MRKPSEFSNFLIDIPFGPYRAVVKYHVDGDTIDVLVDPGWNKYAYEAIRIANFNAWEIYGKKTEGELEKGYAALADAMNLLPVNTQVQIVTYKDKTTFGRYVADIILPDGRDFATEMRKLGHEKTG